MAEESEVKNMSREMRYYHLHREEKLVKLRERYANHPNTDDDNDELFITF